MLNWTKRELRDLYTGLTHTDGEFSNTKTFSSLAYAVASWVVIHQELNSTLSVEMMLVYLGTVAGHNVLLRTNLVKKDGNETKGKVAE